MKVKKKGEDNFKFALNSAVLALLIAVLLMLVTQIYTPVRWASRANMPDYAQQAR